MRTLFRNWWKAIFTYPQKSITTEPVDYDDYWSARGRSEVRISPWQNERSNIALHLFGEEKDATFSVLDVGCGDGAVLHYVKSRHPNMSGTGIDFSESVLARVREAGFKTLHQNISNVKEVSFPTADYTLLFEIIEHIPESELLVQKALEVSKKGICISIPNSGFFTYRLRLLFGKFPAQWVLSPHEHVRFWTLRDVRWWLKALGLEKRTTIKTYQGVPILKHIFPSWFAAGIVLYITHE